MKKKRLLRSFALIFLRNLFVLTAVTEAAQAQKKATLCLVRESLSGINDAKRWRRSSFLTGHQPIKSDGRKLIQGC